MVVLERLMLIDPREPTLEPSSADGSAQSIWIGKQLFLLSFSPLAWMTFFVSASATSQTVVLSGTMRATMSRAQSPSDVPSRNGSPTK